MDNFFDQYRNVPNPERIDPKEVHTFMGLALRWAQIVEKDVGMIEVAFDLGDPIVLTLDRVDNIFDTAFKKTLGRLLNEARKKERVPEGLEELLYNGLKARNRFVHNFIQNHHDHFHSKRGCESMIAELQEIIKLFIKCDQELQKFVVPLLEKYGVTDAKLEELSKRKYGD